MNNNSLDLSELQELFGDDDESINDFLNTVHDEISEHRASLLQTMIDKDLEALRETHHSFKPSLELLKQEALNGHLDALKEKIRNQQFDDSYLEDIARIEVLFDKLLANIQKKIA